MPRGWLALVLLVCLAWPSPARPELGRVGREIPDQVGVYAVSTGQPLEAGDVVAIVRAGRQIGQAIVIQAGPGAPLISLRGVFACRSGDGVVLLRRGAVNRVRRDIGRLDQVPDLDQWRSDFSGGGATFCGPVSASDGLVWLATHGCPGLFAPGGGERQQVAMVDRLARLMKTGKTGTTAANMAAGMQQFLARAGYRGEVSVVGWRSGSDFGASTVPTISWVTDHLGPRECVWLNLGWYHRSPDSQRYTRDGGHWVIVVGCGEDDRGLPDSRVLIVHDPATASARTPKNEFLTLEPLAQGVMQVLDRQPIDARGYLEVTHGLASMPSGDDTAILDAALALAVAPE